MAFIKIESGRVARHVGTRGAFALEEWVTLPDGRTFAKTYTVWNEGTVPPIDAIVAVVGELGTKVRNYVGSDGLEKHVIDVSINQPTVTAIGVPALPKVAEIREAVAQAAPATEVPF